MSTAHTGPTAAGRAAAAVADRWWESRTVALLLVALLAVPLLEPSIPPLVDVPGHLARFAIAVDDGASPYLRGFYEFHWRLIGNLGVDLLVYPLAKVIGVEAATKLVVCAIPVLFGAGLLLCAREAHDRLPTTAPVALIYAYGFPFHYGFVNFYLAVALALCAFALWLRLTRAQRPGLRFALFVPIAAAVWLAHAVGWAILVVICAVSLFQARLTRGDRLPTAALRTVVACLALALPLATALLQAESARGGWTAGWLEPRELLKWALMLNRDRWFWFDLACTALAALLIIAALLRWRGLSVVPALGWPALALAVLYVLTPQWVGGAAFVGSRILSIAVPLALVAIDTQGVAVTTQRWLAAGAAAALGVRLVGTAASLHLASLDYRANLAALDHIAPGSVIATFVTVPCRAGPADWRLPRTLHLGGIATSRLQAFANNQWEIEGVQPLRVRLLAAGDYRHDPSETVTSAPCAGRGLRDIAGAIDGMPRAVFDYVWLIDRPPGYRPAVPWLRPVFANDRTALYRVIRP